MGSFKSNGRELGPKGRRAARLGKRRGSLSLEVLEERQLLSGNPNWHPTTTNLADAQNGPMAPFGGQLISLYEAFERGTTSSSALSKEFPLIQIKNDSVLVGLTASTDFQGFANSLKNLGMQVVDGSPIYGLVDGWLPISALPAAAELPQTLYGSPDYLPYNNNAAINEAVYSTFANVAAQQTGLTGAGVTVGVLSDSFNNLGGYATDVKTGDLPPNVSILQEGTGGEDEGRAMAQNIYHIAPGAGLAFATAFGTTAQFAQNIQALANTAGAKVIVDDVKTPDDPFFQPGLISQAINTVTAQGVSYFSSAGNQADHGYLSNFRGVTGTVNIGGTNVTGTFQNFDGNGGTSLLLPVTFNVTNVVVNFQFDQPWAPQEPAGGPGPTSQLNFYILDSAGNVITSGTSNNVANGTPQQLVQVPSTGSYFVAIRLISGTAPNHVEFVQMNQQSTNDMIVSRQFGTGGGTYYPTSIGHNAQANTIGVGAVPWWSPPPFLNQKPLGSEPFSSFGPSIQVFDASGKALPSAVTTQNPSVTAPDGGNTTFFGFVASTSTPPFPGQPATNTNLYATFTPDQSNLPSFFGTSSAAPNAAAIAAMMLQRVPAATPAQIRQALIQSAAATPMNGNAAAAWDQQGGFGLINAVSAISAIDVLRVSTTNPANGATVTLTPSAITVTFSKPVNFSTVSSGDLVFTAAPAGVTVNVGVPIAVDNPTFPTIIAFPFSVTNANLPPATANGTFSFIVTNANPNAPVMSADGKALVPSSTITFKLADVTAPEVANTSVLSRLVTIQFTKGMNPATITLANVFVQRQGGTGNWNNPIDLNSDPRTKLTYNPLTNTATLDYSQLPQTAMPTDDYRIVVKSGPNGVTDLVGNELDGDFSGTFPSGNGQPGGDFVEDLGLRVLQAPVLTTFQMTPATDTGIAGDQNTKLSQPQFIGQVFANFPGTVANLNVYVEFSGRNGGDLSLDVGQGGRGTNGGPVDVQVTTDAAGAFTISSPVLPEGFQFAKVVVVGQADQPALPGYSSAQAHGFRIDLTPPQVTGSSLAQGSSINQLSSLSLSVIDNSKPTTTPFGTPGIVVFPAINPVSASNVSNYSLILNPGPNQVDESQFITSATFVAGPPVISGGFITQYTGTITLTFAAGLPNGSYNFVAHTTDTKYPGLVDAAGNPLAQSFVVAFSLQSQPVFITNMQMQNSVGATIGGPRSYYELPSAVPGYVPRAAAPPTSWAIDLSNPLPFVSSGFYNTRVQLIGSANTVGGPADGDFGDLGQGGKGSSDPASGFHIVSGTTVVLQYKNASGIFVPADATHPGTRLLMSLAPATTLPADYYRLYLPNQVDTAGNNTRIVDIYGNQLDGEFLGNPTANGSYQDLLNTGAIRNGMSGDGIAGGAFMTGFVVVPPASTLTYTNGAGQTITETVSNIIFARPDYVEDPLLPSTAPDGSLARPYSALAPEGDPNAASQAYPGQLATYNPNHDPNGGLNSGQFFLSGFNPQFDRNGDGVFNRSALYAASQLANRGPVVVVSLPGTPQRNPLTGVVSQNTFVMQAPSGPSSTVNDGSASVPFDTTLVFAAGSTLKLENASLLVQDQGSAIEANGGPGTNVVNFTSFANDAVAGDTNHDGTNTTPNAGDWGGIVLRNFNQAAHPTQTFPIDGTLTGPNGQPAISGADDSMCTLNFTNISYAGGAVPQTIGTRYNAVDLYNSRPAITNDVISFTGGASGTISMQAAIAADLNSFREDDTARGPLVRATTLQNNSLNGIWIRPESTGVAEASNAMTYPSNPTTLGGSINYTLDAPLPYILTSRVSIGVLRLVDTNTSNDIPSRLYVQSGVMIKAQRGASIGIDNPSASLNVGDRTYINEWDLNHNFGPSDPNFKPPTVGDTGILFTSLYDDTATTFHVNADGTKTTYVPAIDSANRGPGAPQPTKGSWGSVDIISGAKAVIDEAEFRYGGGFVNYQSFSQQSSNVLNFTGAFNGSGGTPVYITNNTFDFNQDSPMAISPDGLLAGDPQRPLQSGHPFFRGNVLVNNDINGMSVLNLPSYPVGGPEELVYVPNSDSNTLDVNSVWDTTDLVYIVRGSIILAGRGDIASFGGVGQRPLPSSTSFGQALAPAINLTIESALPDTLLANGQTIARPGESVIVKFLNEPLNAGLIPPGDNVNGSTGASSAVNAGAGFIVGVDNGVDPPASPLLGSGMDSVIRFVGIPGNETTGQARVPVILTSLLDNSVPLTVRGVDQSNTYGNPARYVGTPQVGNRTDGQPLPGDGGLIYFGSKSLMSYNLWDPRGGSLIYNTDIRYMTRVEVQGGGVPDIFNTNPGTATGQNNTYDIGDNPRAQLVGTGSFIATLPTTPPTFEQINTTLNQYNSAKSMMIMDSNFSHMSSAGVLAHPGPANGLARNVGTPLGTGTTAILTGQVFRTAFAGEPVNLFLYNNTFSNMPVGVRMNSDTGNDSTQQNNHTLTLLNNTFYNVAAGVRTVAPEFNPGPPPNAFSNVEWIAMNNIFDGSSISAIRFDGQQYNTMAQYNVYFNNNINVDDEELTTFGFGGNTNPIIGDPKFRNPATGDFRLLAGSVAIDSARSEIGPTFIGNELAPIENQALTFNGTGGIRNTTGRLGFDIWPGANPNDFVTLPGSVLNQFIDQWTPVLTTTLNSYNGTGFLPGTANWVQLSSARGQDGLQRVDDPSTPNVGFGREPFYDVGAFEFRVLNPPKVTAVTALTNPQSPGGSQSINFYSTTTLVGANLTPKEIDVQFNQLIDPSTITASSVLLVGSGGDGIFGNGNDVTINLAGKLSFVAATHTLAISLAGSGLTLPTDRYRLTLLGNGSTVLRNPQGLALDGENTTNDSPNGAQLPLPSGDGFPGGNFYLNFIVNTTPPSVTAGTFKLAPASDTNIVGDFVTFATLPSFVGTISEPNPVLVPLKGQTAIVDIGIALVGPTGTTVYFADSSNIPTNVLPYIRENAGTGLTDVNGNFTVILGLDGAGTGLLINKNPLLTSPYNVGSSGQLVPIPGTVNGYYVARVRVIDQSGNQSNPNNPNAQAPFVVDTVPPVVSVTSPVPNSVLSSSTGPLNFVVDTSENMDLTHFTTSQIQLLKSAPNGSFTGTGVTTIAVGSAITVKYLDAGTGGTGREEIDFSSANGLANGLYQLTLKGTSADNGIRDIAGNFPKSGDVVITFAVFNPNNVTGVFVGGANFVTDPALPQGDRANPFPTIGAALKAAAVGDRIEVLPGVYSENVVLQPLITIASADVSSTDTNFVPGNALATVIRSPATTSGTSTVAVSARGLTAYTNPTIGFVFQAAVTGMTISSSLVGDPALGPINPSAIGMQIIDSTVLVSQDYFIDSGTGIQVVTSIPGGGAPTIENDAIIGNINGIVINDAGSGAATSTTSVINDTVAFNTSGLVAINNATTDAQQAVIANTIFWQNHDQTVARNGVGIVSQTLNKLVLSNNMFSGNGASDTSNAGAAVNIGNGFNPALLGPLPANAAANLGNFTGWPAFIAPRDPRPGGDGPAIFLNDANYGLQVTSAAINNANESVATKTDLLGNKENPNPTTAGLHLPGFGPRDVGAFEFVPVGTPGTTAIGGSFRVVTTSLVPGGAGQANGATMNIFPAPTSIIVDFSQPVNQATVAATDLLLTGTDLNVLTPAKATSVTWLDNHTAQFNLTGQFNSSGSVRVAIASGAIKSASGQTLPGYTDSVVLTSNPVITPSPNPSPNPGPVHPGPITPPPAPAPTAPPRKTKVTHHKVVTPPPHKKVVVPHKPLAHKTVHKPAPTRKPPTFLGKKK
jgi:hypothetical protein